MDDRLVTVVRGTEAPVAPGPPTPGMERRELLADEIVWAGHVRTEPGVASGWHHHGDRDTYIFMIRGTMAIDFGPGGRQRVTGSAGDLIVNPARTVHREETSADGPAEAFVVRIGSGPQNVNVAGPDPD